MLKCRSLILLSALLPVWTQAKVNPDALVGIWQCGPYDMKNGELVITTAEQKKYRKDGRFVELATSVLTFPNGVKTTMQIQMEGQWQLSGEVVTVNFDKAKFISSDNPQYANALGQQQVDQQLKRKNWAKGLVNIIGDKLTYSPLDLMYQQSNVVVICSNAVMESGLEI